MKETELSIIIPVFQVADSLERCVNSVLRQDFSNFQAILVDDGSTDGSGALCDKLSQHDPRITVVHQPNRGLSEARNAGIKLAQSDYITFLDSDDYIGDNTLKPLMNILEKNPHYDILEYSVYERYGHPRRMRMLQLDDREYTDMHEYWYKQKAYLHTYACNKIFRRDLFEQARFPANTNFEDAHIMPKLLAQCKTVATTSRGYYYYCYNPRSITVKASAKDWNDLLTAHLHVLHDSNGLLSPPDMEYYAHVLNIAIDVYDATGQVPYLPSPAKLNIKPTAGKGTPLKVRLLKAVGLRKLCQLIHILHKILRRH